MVDFDVAQNNMDATQLQILLNAIHSKSILKFMVHLSFRTQSEERSWKNEVY